MGPCHTAVMVSEASQVGEARRAAARLAQGPSFDETACGRIAIVVTELAGNLARHAVGGQLLLAPVSIGEHDYFDILAIDRGPGMTDLERCRRDGFSTSSTPGNGLGAAQRLAAEFDIYSNRPSGTVAFARVAGRSNSTIPPRRYAWGFVNVPFAGEERSGDTWSVAENDDLLALVVADGLGHGPLAADASAVAATAFREMPFDSPRKLLGRMDEKMRGTRGAAVATLMVDAQAGKIRFAGIGNIAGHVMSRDPSRPRRGMVTHNGTVGVQSRTPQEFEYECDENSMLVVHSDGVHSRWALDAYPGLAACHPAVVAGVLMRDFSRGRDDATIGVICLNKRGSAHG